MKKLLLFSLIFFISFMGSSQERNNLKELVELYKDPVENEERIDSILENDPELAQLLETYKEVKIQQAKDQEGTLNFTEAYFELEAEKIKMILSEGNLQSIKDLFYTVHNSQYAKDISYIVIRQMEIARDELEQGIKQFPKPPKN